MKPISRWLLVPGLVLVSFLLAANLHEWLLVGVIKNPADIAQYPFGSEEAMGEGRWYYATAGLYARHMLISCLALLPAGFAFLRALLWRSGFRVAVAYGLLILTLLVSGMFNQYMSA
ncbi:hypothetical protein LGH74_10895 [Hymenobacter sp. BT178]|uniref:DUF1634 domain-containing protein n=2 Tax=Hymenobacter lucidus TaxID=2880930 RepID=A0ABS8ARV7_9BACT|nr:hypothetical protein [Hymenobacter lucidus]